MIPVPETLAPGKIYLILETPKWSEWMPEPIPGQGGGGPDRQVVKSSLPTSTVMSNGEGVDCSWV
jgi:hypothetical protein